MALGILTFVHYSSLEKQKNQNKLIKNKDPTTLFTHSKDSPGFSQPGARAHTRKCTCACAHTQETVKGLISFEKCMGQFPYFSNFKTGPPTNEVRMPHSASGVARVWLSALFFLSRCLRKEPCIWQLTDLHSMRPSHFRDLFPCFSHTLDHQLPDYTIFKPLKTK